MADSFSETTHVGWGSRLIESIKGVGIGFLLVGISVFGLFWNEGRAVHRQQALEEGAAAVIPVNADKVDPANNAKLIHVSGPATSAKGLADDQFDIKAADALRLNRKVEMYQWEQNEKTETKKNLGGSEDKVTTYTYDKVWRDTLINSSQFKKPGHENPQQMPYNSASTNADDVKLGAFKVNVVVLDHLTPNKAVAPAGAPVENATPAAPESKTKRAYTVSNGMLYFGNASNPAIGDARIAFTEFPAGPVSIVARQKGDTFEEYPAKTGGVLLVQAGSISADAMFKQAEEENRTLTWIIRAVGFVLIAIGFGMMFAPFVTLADVVPIIGSVVGAGTFVAAMIFAIPVWLITVALAWVYYRPVIGIALLAAAIAVPILFAMFRSKKTVQPA